MVDRRQYERVDLSAPGRLSAAWIGRSPCDGVIENLSRNGLLVRINGMLSNGLPATGDFMTVDILLPARRSFVQKSLRCRGKVARISATEGVARIGLAIEHMTFRNLGETRHKTPQPSWDEILWRA
jgi:PilZ domain